MTRYGQIPESDLAPFAAAVAVVVISPVIIPVIIPPVIIPVPFIPIPAMIVPFLAAVALPITGIKLVPFVARTYPRRAFKGRPRVISIVPSITIV